MEKEIKLTSDEQREIVELNAEYQDILLRFGELYIKESRIRQETDEISSLKERYGKLYEETQKKEVNFKERISRKYGEGEIDVESGIYFKKEK